MSDFHSGSRETGPDPTSTNPQLTGMLRLICQMVGLGLLLVGCYYGLGIVFTVLGYIREPATLQAPAEQMATTLNLDSTTIVLGENEPIAVGRAVGTFFLLLWYVGAGWILLKVISVGGQLMLATFNERREFYAATREMMVAVRRERDAAAKQHE